MQKTLPEAGASAPPGGEAGEPTSAAAPAPRPEGGARRRGLLIALKAALSVLLIGWLLSRVDLRAMWDHLAHANLAWIGVAFAIWLGQYLINALKWQAAMRVHGLHYPLPFLIRVYLISSFFTNFFPSSIGGDGYRVLRTLPRERRSRAVSAVLLERLVGVASLLLLGTVGAGIVVVTTGARLAALYLTAAAAGFLALGLVLALLRTDLMRGLWARVRGHPKVDGLATNFDDVMSDPAGVARVLVFSLLFQSFAILAIWIIARFGLDTAFTVPETALTAALSEIAAALPVSLNGLGLMEGTFAYVGEELGILFDDGLLVAVTLRLLLIPLGVICGLVYLVEVLSGRSSDRPEASTS